MDVKKPNVFFRAKEWVASVFSAPFFWWVAKSFLFPSLSFILLFLFLELKNSPFNLWIDVVARQEVLIVAIATCVTTLFDLTSDVFLWPKSRRGVLSFAILLFLILLCAGTYGVLAAQLQPVRPEDRARIVGWIAGMSFTWALFVQIVISPKPSIGKIPSGGD
jgi:hypothetical protein